VEAPHLKRLHQKYFGQGLRMIGVTQMDPTVAEIRAFLKRHSITYPIVLDPDEKVGKLYRLEGHPTGVVVDRKGLVRYVHSGFVDGEEKENEAAIQAVIADRPVPKGGG
jgi:peroxiredoxin